MEKITLQTPMWSNSEQHLVVHSEEISCEMCEFYADEIQCLFAIVYASCDGIFMTRRSMDAIIKP